MITFELQSNILWYTDDVLTKVLHNKSLLKIFHYSWILRLQGYYLINYKTNLNLHSLKLIFKIYLNVQCQFQHVLQRPINTINVKLKRFYLTLKQSYSQWHKTVFIYITGMNLNIISES